MGIVAACVFTALLMSIYYAALEKEIPAFVYLLVLTGFVVGVARKVFEWCVSIPKSVKSLWYGIEDALLRLKENRIERNRRKDRRRIKKELKKKRRYECVVLSAARKVLYKVWEGIKIFVEFIIGALGLFSWYIIVILAILIARVILLVVEIPLWLLTEGLDRFSDFLQNLING